MLDESGVTVDPSAEAEWLRRSASLYRQVSEPLKALAGAVRAKEALPGDENAWLAVEAATRNLRDAATAAKSGLGAAPTPRTTEIRKINRAVFDHAVAAADAIDHGLETPNEFEASVRRMNEAMANINDLAAATNRRSKDLTAWAVAHQQPGAATTRRRQAIPAQVRREVWRRDEGRCVDCGSRERLEFDHIIPVIEGGSNTARNIELRCESCNRSKGARI